MTTDNHDNPTPPAPNSADLPLWAPYSLCPASTPHTAVHTLDGQTTARPVIGWLTQVDDRWYGDDGKYDNRSRHIIAAVADEHGAVVPVDRPGLGELVAVLPTPATAEG